MAARLAETCGVDSESNLTAGRSPYGVSSEEHIVEFLPRTQYVP